MDVKQRFFLSQRKALIMALYIKKRSHRVILSNFIPVLLLHPDHATFSS